MPHIPTWPIFLGKIISYLYIIHPPFPFLNIQICHGHRSTSQWEETNADNGHDCQQKEKVSVCPFQWSESCTWWHTFSYTQNCFCWKGKVCIHTHLPSLYNQIKGMLCCIVWSSPAVILGGRAVAAWWECGVCSVARALGSLRVSQNHLTWAYHILTHLLSQVFRHLTTGQGSVCTGGVESAALCGVCGDALTEGRSLVPPIHAHHWDCCCLLCRRG